MSRDEESREEQSLLLTVLCGIIYKSSASPSCIARPFTAWHMLRPHACISSHEGRFAIGLETGGQGKKIPLRWGLQMEEKTRFGTISHFSPCVWCGIKIQEETWFSVKMFHEHHVLRNTRFSLKTMKTPWLNLAHCDVYWSCVRFCWEGLSKRQIELEEK